MHLCLRLLPVTQSGYEPQIMTLSERIEGILGEECFANADLNDVSRIISDSLTSLKIPSEEKRELLSSLLSISWWCGLGLQNGDYSKIGEFVRATLTDESEGLPLSNTPIQAMPNRHNLFVGELIGPLHSPSRGAVDYIRALVRQPQTEQVTIYYAGSVKPAMVTHLQEALTGTSARAYLQPINDPDLLRGVINSGNCINHVWCANSLSKQITQTNRLGPTIMFTCGDVPPFQYADVYWYFHDHDYIKSIWRPNGVPEYMISNYVQCDAGPNDDRLRPQARLSKSDIGIDRSHVLLATVGNRLTVEMNDDFISGIYSVLAGNKHAHWLIVGQLSEQKRLSLGTLFGRQISHRPFESALPVLMTAVDIFVNPFRSGGADSAMRAMTSGAVIFSRGDLGDVGSLIPSEHRQIGAKSYFSNLTRLVSDQKLRSEWASLQKEYGRTLADQDRFGAALTRMIEIACARWNSRRFNLRENVDAR